MFHEYPVACRPYFRRYLRLCDKRAAGRGGLASAIRHTLWRAERVLSEGASGQQFLQGSSCEPASFVCPREAYTVLASPGPVSPSVVVPGPRIPTAPLSSPVTPSPPCGPVESDGLSSIGIVVRSINCNSWGTLNWGVNNKL